MSCWHFNELTPSDKTREAMQGEFFATEAIRNAAEALVREAIQNSLDAGLKNNAGHAIETVRVRFHLATGPSAAKAADCAEFFDGAWPHFLADGNGLNNKPTKSEQCSFLVVEDFGTSGLVGDVEQWADEPGVKNAFYYFFRAEGRTGKGEEDRGRWGVGKYVFPRSSRAKSFFGFTIRGTDQKRLLMGQSILRTHKCGTKHYKPDGGFGDARNDGLLLPTQDDSIIERFRAVFSVSRRDEPGLSIVIPWIDTEEITRTALLEAVVRGYFYPILDGKLAVTMSEGGMETVIDADTLTDVVNTLGDEVSRKLVPLIELAVWASERKPAEFLKLNLASDRPNWSAPDIIPPDAVPVIQSALERGERVAIQAPVKIRARGKPDQTSFFEVFFVRDGTDDDRTTFIREGIIISDVRARRARGIRSLVIVDDRGLATLLGDSENPAHTEWQSKSSNFQGKYTNGPSYLKYVTDCVKAIDDILSSHQREEDTTLLKDFFSLPAPPDPNATKTRQKKKKKPKGPVTPDPEPLPEPRKKRYRLEKVAGGFRVCTGDPDAEVPALIEIRTAYDVRRGNALKKYDPADFDLADKEFKITGRGVEVTEGGENRMLVKILVRDFELSVTGFDEKRDVLVNINVKEAEDAAQV